MEKNKIIQGDALEVLKTLESESVNCVMTSPPYWALRDYGIEGQLGLEPTFEEHITKMCDVFDEVKRVLRKDGTCWVNYGDTYGGTKVGNTETRISKRNVTDTFKKSGGVEKSLVMIPFRFAIEMVNRGWILRNVIIWHKPNPMPSSAKDRFTVDFEYLFFFSKSKKYWFEQQFEKALDQERLKRRPFNPDTEKKWKRDNTKTGQRINPKTHEKSFERIRTMGRNTRCVWKIPTQPFPEAHFAVFPEKLCVTPIKAGCPPNGIVLDPFMGSGTTAKVARKLGRNYIGIELSPEYIKIAEKRLSQQVLI